ncbi:EsaB/YukD family protein [Mycobacteroides abscessus]|uniref:EsaB/YukD family protein n=1 Tax=Mycobacteroides abscessus TaxID=36809 RepID=UPI0009D36076|nr:EsaB/YukD family protein [Mycobacteroides abscessus]SKH87118.1 Protein of uncharacterised function (DUF571) [Mycobacteroides abscessus subsp. massiliense]SKH91600.1 Protein of uncharacterised function (DUF571) [Mycobacteroides abscessus subsp. massiliense]SKI12383.1 Protein of uncharacterised function (DUF571) [Mycobacteroides abscessus subsp. massiliense]SKK23103.1 Protein of uncharacterised function (DUF571) [Mycobacteroides abscessus subsp. massiliense]SKK30171.1 Protein of uncharacteris
MSADTVTGVSIAIGKSTQVDLELSNTKPLHQVLSDLELYLGQYLDEVGSNDELPSTRRGWRLRTPLGTVLDQGMSLEAHNIKTGMGLELIEAPRGEQFMARIESASTFLSRLGQHLYQEATPDNVTPVLAVGASSMLAGALALLEVISFRSPNVVNVAILLTLCALVGLGALVASQASARALRAAMKARELSPALTGLVNLDEHEIVKEEDDQGVEEEDDEDTDVVTGEPVKRGRPTDLTLVTRYRVLADICMVLLLLFTPPAVSLGITLLYPGPWGGPHLMAAAWTVVVLAFFGLATGRYVVAYTALLVTAVSVAATYTAMIVAALFTDNPQTSAEKTLIPTPTVSSAVLFVVISALLMAEVMAPWAAKLPNATFPSGSGRFIGRRGSGQQRRDIEAAAAPPDPVDMLGRGVRANQTLTGILLGLAFPAAALSAIIVYEHPDSWPWQLCAAGIPAVFAYRTFHYGGLTNVSSLLFGTFASALALVAAFSAARGLWWGVGLCAVVALLALLAPLSIPTEGREQAPIWRMARMVSEFVVIAWVLLAPYVLLRIVQKAYNRDFS